MRGLRIPTWLLIAWTLVFGLFLLGDVFSPGDPGAVASFLSSSAPVSLQTWALGAAPLVLLWYATRPGVPRRRLGLAVLATLVTVAVLLAFRQWPVDAPAVAPAALGIAGTSG
jgi:hypothetical protein